MGEDGCGGERARRGELEGAEGKILTGPTGHYKDSGPFRGGRP